jgi:hypothetical protein
MREITQKYLLINNLDLLYSKLTESSIEELIQLDKLLKTTDESSYTIVLENKKQKNYVEKILIMQGYTTASNFNTFSIKVQL